MSDDLKEAVARTIESGFLNGYHANKIADAILAVLPNSSAASLAEALRKILFLRPGGPCRNKLIEEMENIASEALSSAPLPPVEDGWREPESAPRDGTDFLAAFSKRVFINQWDTTYRTWIEPFTAWRPLPPPPSDRSGG